MKTLRHFACIQFIVMLCALNSSKVKGQSWEARGFDDFDFQLSNFTTSQASIPSISFTRLALNNSGVPFVMTNDPSQNFRTIVKKFTGDQWLPVGDSVGNSFVEGDICVDTAGLPCVVFRDGANSQKITVKQFDGIGWNVVGSTGISAGQASIPSVAIDKLNRIYIAYRDASYTNKVVVKMWDGNTWSTLGAAGLSVGMANSLSLCIDKNNTPYVAYGDQAFGNGKAVVKRYQNNVWDSVGVSGFSSGVVNIGNISVDTTGNVYVLYKDFALSSKLSVQKFNGVSWSYLGGAGFTSNNIVSYDMGITSGGIPYIFYHDPNSGTYGSVKYFNGISWDYVGNLGFTVGTPASMNVSINSTGVMMIAYYDALLKRRFVKRLNPQHYFSNVGVGFAEGRTNSLDMALDTSGSPYTVYVDGAHGDKISVRAYINGVWQYIGSPGFSGTSVKGASILVCPNNDVYVSYIEVAGGDSVIVRKLVNSSWSFVGKIACSGTSVSDLQCDSLNNVYLHYTSNSPFQNTIAKFNGSSWITFSIPPISGPTSCSFEVSKSGIVYLAYTDFVSGITVLKCENNMWSSVGSSSGLSVASQPFVYTLCLTQNDTLFLAYVETAMISNNNTLKVKKFDGSGWINYLSNVDTGNITQLKLVFQNNDPVLAYANADRGVGFFTKKNIAGTSIWDFLGNGSISRRQAFGINLDASRDSIYVVYSDIQDAFAKVFNSIATPLSINKTILYVSQENNKWQLTWNVNRPDRVKHFEVEKLTSGFQKVDLLLASNAQSTYVYSNDPLIDNSYYRIKIVSLNGVFSYSNVVFTRSEILQDVFLYPNPTYETLNLTIKNFPTGTSALLIHNSAGQILRSRYYTHKGALENIALDISDLQPGIYQLTISNHSLQRTLNFVKK
ncbi:MAG TPA: T9SS type A sorting domain-containing protein [Flavipsychrobacter sp.]|nr:T9SS type A sorting domain-containing protein [Flavipsychrobacter sp.]